MGAGNKYHSCSNHAGDDSIGITKWNWFTNRSNVCADSNTESYRQAHSQSPL